MADAFLVRYKIKVHDEVKHSSYLYQKLFRAIYGYTQVVCKQNRIDTNDYFGLLVTTANGDTIGAVRVIKTE